MILYLYAIAEGLGGVGDVTGVMGEPLVILMTEGIQVVAGNVEAAPSPEPLTLAGQDAVVRRLHARAASLLPMRFGAAFSSDADMQRALKLRAARLGEQLALVKGKEQMTLRILGAPGAQGAPGAPGAPGAQGAQGAPGAGAAYLRARAEKAVPPDIIPLLDDLKPLQRATRVEVGKTAGVVATVYQLIERGTAQQYEEAVSSAAARMSDLVVRVSGPAPCYAFS